MEDDGLELVLKGEGFGAVTLVEDVAVQSFEDFNVLFTISLHVFRPAGPCVFGRLAVIALHDAEPLAPCVEAVAPGEAGREAAGLLAECGEVEVLEVGPDEPRGGQGVEQPGEAQVWVELSDCRGVEAQAVVRHEERGSREQPEAVHNLPRPERKGLPREEVLRAEAVDGGGFVQQAVGFDVEQQGRGVGRRDP